MGKKHRKERNNFGEIDLRENVIKGSTAKDQRKLNGLTSTRSEQYLAEESTKTQQIKRRKLLGANEKWKIDIEGKDEDEEEDYRGGAEEETKEEEQKEGDEGSQIDMESNE